MSAPSPALPASVPWVRVEAALARFGIDLDGLRSVALGVEGITVERFELDDKGRPRLRHRARLDSAGEIQRSTELVTTETFIPYTRS